MEANSRFLPVQKLWTLQVRYCTKLKAKTTVWTDEQVRDNARSI